MNKRWSPTSLAESSMKACRNANGLTPRVREGYPLSIAQMASLALGPRLATSGAIQALPRSTRSSGFVAANALISLASLSGCISGLLLCRLHRANRGTGDTNQRIAKLRWRGIPDLGFILAANHRHHADAPGLLVAVALQGDGMQTLR